MNVKYDFTGKVVLVTGGASGIGFATAAAFAKAGAKVVVADINADAAAAAAEKLKAEGGFAVGCLLDVTSGAQIDSVIRRIVGEFGSLDILHANAGIDCKFGPTAECDEADFDRVMAVNVKGVFLSMKYALKQMEMQGSGIIVATASAMALTVLPNSMAYITSKHAVAGMVKAASVEYAETGIRINAICPGVVVTPLVQKALDIEEFNKELVNLTSVKRLGTVDEIADAVLWMSSDAATFVHGTLITVDGGWNTK
ncbi:SDR family NAD(P)-dependent oxidoreductase [Paraburkholderia sp. BR14374]|uniref:SDR family NAD(P)-dependent oxidoreductase n=1 Tax=Paraburkholderia sp. BR14374 TaxID=3237007 RepID=UPI0034CED1A0